MWAAGYRRIKSRMARAIVDLVGGRCGVILEADCGETVESMRLSSLQCKRERRRTRTFSPVRPFDPIECEQSHSSRKKPRTKISWPRRTSIQREVQVENVHTRFAEEAEIAPVGVFLNQFANLLVR